MKLTEEILSTLKTYSETLNKGYLLSLTSDTVANVVHTIFVEAVRTYNEDLPNDAEYIKTRSITSEFCTDILLYPTDCIFWEYDLEHDPWYVMITIDDAEPNDKIDFIHHNCPSYELMYISSNNKLDGIYCKMDIYASHSNWRYKFVQVIFKCISECYIYYLHELEIMEAIAKF